MPRRSLFLVLCLLTLLPLAAAPQPAAPKSAADPLADPLETDQMPTEYATSSDGLVWVWQGTALAGRPGEWDSRGTRVAAGHPRLLDGCTPHLGGVTVKSSLGMGGHNSVVVLADAA